MEQQKCSQKQKVSLRNYDYKRASSCDSPRLRFVQRSGIIFLTRRHRKLGRTRVVDTVHSSSLCVCPPGLESRIGIGASRSLQITFGRPSHTRPFHEPISRVNREVNRGSHNSSNVNARSCLYFVLGSEAIRG